MRQLISQRTQEQDSAVTQARVLTTNFVPTQEYHAHSADIHVVVITPIARKNILIDSSNAALGMNL